MRRTYLIAVLTLLGGCSDSVEQSQSIAQQQKEPTIVYVSGGLPYPVKVPPYVDEPALRAQDQRSCIAAGGEWDYTYELGVLYSRTPFDSKYYGDHPEDALVKHPKQCWSTRKPVAYADAGKPCKGQSDCEMNCIAKSNGSGHFEPPKCQATEQDQPNCEYVYDKGEYHATECAIP